MEELKNELIKMVLDNLPFLKIVAAFVAYSAMEYWFGKTDKVKEGSFMEFVWARVKGLFSPSKGIKPNDSEPKV